MKANIHAIETKYAGCRFRSRLEARWAVFLDACDIQWRYEPEGFVLNNGSTYLPDFFFPDYDCYGEVKSKDGDFSKSREFCLSTHKTIILLEDVPALKYYDTFQYDDWNGTLTEDIFRVFFDSRPNDGKDKIVINQDGPDSAWWDKTSFIWNLHSYSSYADDFSLLQSLDRGFKTIEHAIEKATSARFEFGENGK